SDGASAAWTRPTQGSSRAARSAARIMYCIGLETPGNKQSYVGNPALSGWLHAAASPPLPAGAGNSSRTGIVSPRWSLPIMRHGYTDAALDCARFAVARPCHRGEPGTAGRGRGGAGRTARDALRCHAAVGALRTG